MPESNVIKIESSVNELKDKVGDMAANISSLVVELHHMNQSSIKYQA